MNEITTNIDQREPWQKMEKFNMKIIVLISFGFFASSAAWSVYNSQISLAFERLFPGQYLLVGFLMTLDNLIGIFVQPYTGNLSDRTRSRFGRRMPFVIIGLPISAVLLSVLPLLYESVVGLMSVVILFVCAMAAWRAPVVSLMPDFVAPQERSKGNAIVNMLGGIAMAVASLIGGQLIKINALYGFMFIAGMMLVALVVLLVGVHEPDTRQWNFDSVKSKEKKEGIIAKFQELSKESEKSPFWMIGAIFFWFVSYNAVETLLSIYAVRIVGVSEGTALQLFFIVSVSFILFAIPSAKLAKKVSRKNTILIGLIICTLSLLSGLFVQSPSMVWLLWVILATFGMGWAFINVNSIAMIWEMASTPKQIGTYTGIYYFGSFMAAVAGPLTLGYIMEYITGLEYLFPVSTIFMIMAILCMLKVKRGEPELTEEQKQAKLLAIQKAGTDD